MGARDMWLVKNDEKGGRARRHREGAVVGSGRGSAVVGARLTARTLSLIRKSTSFLPLAVFPVCTTRRATSSKCTLTRPLRSL